MSERRDDKTWFSRRVGEELDALYGTAFRLARSHADADDLVAETVSKAWSAIDSLEDRDRFRPWVFRILRNCFISACRKKAVRPAEFTYEEELDTNESDAIVPYLNEQPDSFLEWWSLPEKAYFNGLLGDAIVAALDSLPDAFRITVLLVNVEGLTYDEAAEAMGVPPGTVRSRMKRGRTMLQKALWRQARDRGWSKEVHEDD